MIGSVRGALLGSAVLAALATATIAPASAGACNAGRHASARSLPGALGRAPLQVGDSTSILAAPTLGALGIESDARGCRQFGQGLELIAARRHAHTLPAVVILSLGANGPVGAGQIARALSIVGRQRILALVTPAHSPVSAAAIRRAAARHPSRILLIDWVAYSAGRGGGWFAGDGLHVSYAGASAYAHLIKRRVAPYAFPPVRRLHLPKGSSRAQRCGVIRRGGVRRRVFIVRGHGRVLCRRARQLASRSPLRPAAGWVTYDWRRAPGVWDWVYVRDRRTVVATKPF